MNSTTVQKSSNKKWKIGLWVVILVPLTLVAWRVLAQTSAEESQSPIVKANRESETADGDPDLATGITAGIDNEVIRSAAHPLLPLLEIAEKALERIEQSHFDYTATMTNQVRVNGRLRDTNKAFVKIRHPRELDDGTNIPFSVYMKFIEPKANAGREVIWVDGWNDGNMMVHLTGWQNLMRISLDPEGPIAMDGNLYPISMIGMKNLLKQIHEKGTRDSKHEAGEVTITRGLELDGRIVTMIESVHPQQRPHFEYHIARIYLDEDLGLPVGYEGFLWPEKEGGPPVLLEKYFYTDIQLNVGLTDFSFDPGNPEYDFPAR